MSIDPMGFSVAGAPAGALRAPLATTAPAGATPPQGAGPVDGNVAPARLANAKLGQGWSNVAQGSGYHQLFGDASYVKDGSDPQLLSLLQEALAQSPELQGTSLAAAVQRGKVGPDDVKELQQFLQSKGISCGSTGVDGKYGPRTHGALESFLRGEGKGPCEPGGTPASPAAMAEGPSAPMRGGLARRGRPAPAGTPSPAQPQAPGGTPAAAQPQPPGGTAAAAGTPEGLRAASIPKGAPGHSGMTTGAPEGYHTIKGEVSRGVTGAAKELLAGEYGTETPFDVDGKRYMGRVEQHYHPPGYQGGPNGWHKGVTVYEAT